MGTITLCRVSILINWYLLDLLKDFSSLFQLLLIQYDNTNPINIISADLIAKVSKYRLESLATFNDTYMYICIEYV